MRARWLSLAVLIAVNSAAAEHRAIANIATLLDQCPDRDPAFAEISRDFKIRRAGVLVPTPPCTEPVSAIPVSQYTDELIHLQALRVMYYMDRGMSGHLPWTSGTLYDWVKSKIGGIDIVAGTGAFCCEYYGPPPEVPVPVPGGPPPPPPPPQPHDPRYYFIGVAAQDDFNREFNRKWPNISGLIALYAHEARHIDGYPHSSCCGIPGGCDDAFDPANLSPYGLQWWLNSLWLNGTINVGYECQRSPDISVATSWFLSGVNSVYRERFCSNLPPIVNPPLLPGGACAESGPRRRAVRH